jgi:hypothetical protein
MTTIVTTVQARITVRAWRENRSSRHMAFGLVMLFGGLLIVVWGELVGR